MNLAQLIEDLQSLSMEIEENGGDPSEVEVMLAHQPSWPLEMGLAQAALVDLNAPDAEAVEEHEYALEEMSSAEERRDAQMAFNAHYGNGQASYKVYLAEGYSSSNGYLNGVAREVLGWSNR